MPSYASYSQQDFVMDEFFQHWVLHPGDLEADVYWRLWLSEHPEKQAETDQAREIILAMRFSNYELEKEAVANLWQKIQVDENAPAGRKGKYLWFWFAAASVIVAALLTAVIWLNKTEYVEFSTAYGETRKIVLPDNSVVVLNANSTLRYDRDWEGRKVRELWIGGEAHFTIAHTQDNQIFKVHTLDGVTVEVLGTVFNLYNRHQQTKVVLSSGKIQLQLPNSPGNERIVMEPGEMIEYHEEKYSRHYVNPVQYSAWTMNRLELDHTTLLELVTLVEDNYGLSIEVTNNELLKQTVSGSMPYGDAKNLLKQIATSFQLSLRREKDVFYLEEER